MIDTTNLPAGVLYRSTWGNYQTEARRAYGHAARRNRSRNTGVKVHKLVAVYVVGLIDETVVERAGTFGETFRRTRQPVLFSCHPACGCTSGQHAGAPDARFTAAHVTCSKCGPTTPAATA
jgi:hypothetical protein